MSKRGIVIAVDGSMATVELCEKTKCDTCPKRANNVVCESCPEYTDRKAMRVLARNKVGADIGDIVEYGKSFSENSIFTLLVFVLPVFCALLSYFISVLFTDDNAVKSRIAVIVFIIVTAVAYTYSHKRSKKHCDYTISSVIKQED